MRFHKIYVEITDICKLSCSFCTPKKAKRGIMPIPLFKHIIEQIANHTKFISLHVLGDPLCVENLDEYIDIGALYGVKFDIVSSGIFLQQKHFKVLTQSHIHQVSFSLDAFFDNKNLHKDIKQYFDEIISFYTYANIYAPKLYINLRLFGKYDYTYLLQRFPDSIMQIEKRRLRLAKNFFLRFHRPFTWHTKHKLDNIKDVSTHSYNFDKSNKPYCFGSIKQLAILANGVVVPCCIDACGFMPLGNLCQQDFIDILNSSTMQTMQKAQYTYANIPKLCRTCTFRGV